MRGASRIAGGLGYELITRIDNRGVVVPLPELALTAVAAPVLRCLAG